MKYNCLNPIAKVGLDKFGAGYEQTENIADAEIALVRSASMHELELPDSLIAIARAGAGVNNIPLDKCAEKGIVVFNSPGANANGVKELVICGMLLACRDIVGSIEWVKENKDDENIAKAAEKAKKAFAGTEIRGKSLGVIGLGAIGVLVANAAVNLGMKVYGYDPYLSVRSAWSISNHVINASSPEDIYKQCDFITIHVPLTDSTRGMIGKEAISMMKPEAVVLNFARDPLVDEKAIVEALESGKIKRYVCDFPNPTTAGAKNCIIISHLGASTEESEDNCAVMAVEELVDYVENGNIRNSVNYAACSLGVCDTVSRVAIMNRNIKNVINKFTSVFSDAGLNIEHMSNVSRGDFAYNLVDLDGEVGQDMLGKLAGIEGVIRVRKVK